MASERLLNICEAIVDCPHSTPVWTESGVVVLRNQNIRGGRLDLSTPSFTDEAHYQKRTKRIVPRENDLIITREAPMGEVCRLPAGLRCCLGQRMVLLRPEKSRVDSGYLLYAIQSPSVQHEILVNEGTGSTVSNLRIPVLESLPIPLPPLPEQKRIANVLGTLDDKIEMNRRMNATLEAMSRALFKSWFVDFDPVRQKAAGKQPVGMDAETAALFPDSFEDSELGEVPTGWEVKQVQECCDSIQNGGTPKRSTERYWLGGKIPWLTSGEVRQPIVTATESFITEDGLSDSSAKWIPKGSTVVALYGATAGEVSMVATDMTTNQAICSLIPKPKQQCFVFNSMLESREIMKSKAVGSAQQNISKAIVAETLLVRPVAELVSLFEDTVLVQLEQRIANQEQSRTLSALRDTLLPKLLSGEIRVPEAEEAVEEAVG